MKLLKFAAIDIGSNAVRLLFTNVIEDEKKTSFRKSSLIRIPLRLGEDSFNTGVISEKKIKKLSQTMMAFKYLMEVQEVVAFRACATSAMREAENGKDVVTRVKNETGIEIEIIEGKEEAEIIYSNQIVEMIDDLNPYLYVDVGGGSTEISLFADKKRVATQSFDVGTIRILSNKIGKKDFQVMKKWVKDLDFKGKEVKLIGSGGNINKIFKISGIKDNQPLLYSNLADIHKFISFYSIEERIKILGMNPDRADVIIPASEIFLKIMKWSDANQVIVPTIGVSDGIVHQLYKEYSRQKKEL
ncbi:MAG: exopolyphosphatase [Bacteroidales bacterium]|nr:exopolyphosphatase [Bacteroidales bacterium]